MCDRIADRGTVDPTTSTDEYTTTSACVTPETTKGIELPDTGVIILDGGGGPLPGDGDNEGEEGGIGRF